MDIQELKREIDHLLAVEKYDEIKPLLLSYKTMTEHDNDLATICYLCTIYEQEKEAGRPVIFSKVSCMDELLERYTKLKFYLRRIDFDVLGLDRKDFDEFLIRNHISSYELLRVIAFSVVHKEKVLQFVKGEDIERKATDEMTMKERIRVSAEQMAGKEVQEFCFIICTHRPLYAQECIYYIEHLIVPENIRIDILTVEDASSLTSAYNEAMRYSGAKYKVYLHQDTFIVNPNFIQDCLDVFHQDPHIGMLGNIGVRNMPDSGVMWDQDRFGMVYEQHIYETEPLANAFSPELEYLKVDAIDGFLMVTQYDIPWREDLFTKWDFYDCSQSMEFIRKGYTVVVPNMKEPWCVHDCGFINLRDYEEERKKFVKEYLL